jgi:uncharacterized cupredoxin-like copper-binding protein
MKKRTLLLSMVFVFALVAIVNSAAIAQDQSHQNLKDMSELLKDISAQLSTGKMTPDAQKTAGKITQRVGHILQELAGLGHGVHYNHQADIKKMKKSWDPFAEQAATED